MEEKCGRLIRVLIVEDEPEIAKWMEEVVVSVGDVVDEVTVVSSYDEAVKIITDGRLPPPAVLVTDIRLPGPSDGTVLGKLVRQRDQNAVIICVTGYPNLLFRREVVELPVDDFLLKPFTADQLRVSVLRAVASYYRRCRFSQCLELKMSTYRDELRKLREIEDKYRAALHALLAGQESE